jgi:hypothetical protein
VARSFLDSARRQQQPGALRYPTLASQTGTAENRARCPDPPTKPQHPAAKRTRSPTPLDKPDAISVGRRCRQRHQARAQPSRLACHQLREQAGIVVGAPPAPDSYPHRRTREHRSERSSHGMRVLSGRVAGPSRTPPSTSKREPWQGQSQLSSALLKRSRQPRCVHRRETAWRWPTSSR